MSNFPFAGIVTERPYPETGLTSARWKAEVPVEPVFLNTLILTQDGVYFHTLFRTVFDENSDPYPHVVEFNGQYFLEDGHNRCCRAAIRGELMLLMRVYRRQ